MDRATTDAELAVKYAMAFVGTQYRWGGDDPMAGFDCSGFVIEVLKGVGYLPYNGDWRAFELFEMFREVDNPTIGVLVFWGIGKDQIGHVELCISDKIAIGAGGGDRKVMTTQDAIKYNAYVRLRPIKRPEKRLMYFADPF